MHDRPLAPGSTQDDLRRQNLSQVLRLVHRSGPLTRAELTRATGLNRSTIGGLVGELADRGLVLEQEPSRAGKVGRPSPVAAASEATVAIAVVPETDAIDIGVVTLGGRIIRRVRYRNEHTPSAAEFVNIVQALVAGIEQGLDAVRIVGIGAAVPALVRDEDGVVVFAPHLLWRDVELADAMTAATGLPARITNDANAGVVAESVFGAGRESGIVVYLNGGASGIGGGIFVDGRMLGGNSGYAGEFGHTLVNSAGRRCHCGAVGCLETEVHRDLFVAAADIEVDDLQTAVADAWRSVGPGHDELARQLGYVAVAVRGIVNVLNPQTIVLGGYLAALADAVGADALRAAIGETLPGSIDDVSIVSTGLGADILLLGAAELVFGAVIDDPTSMPVIG